ncbi:uncharacterized protein LOC144141005 [Haemaphysalis longicornis]
MSSLLAPLYQLLCKNAGCVWGEAQDTAFANAKQCLLAAGVLVHYDPAKPFKLECDASPHGIGAVLFHTDGKVNRPIGFRSRTLTTAERNYSQLEREALALIFGVTKFRDYLLDRDFTLVTDPQPLLGLLKAEKPTPALAAALIQRWALYLNGFRYKLHYSPGKLLLNADTLSQLPLQTPAPPASEEWTLPPDTAVYAHNYGQGEKWTPGKVQSTTGSRMVIIQTPAGVVRRHINQPPNFHDKMYEDVDDWHQYERVASYNLWNAVHKLRNVYYSLEDGARIWLENHESSLRMWDDFGHDIREAFPNADRRDSALQLLESRVQKPHESVPMFAEDMAHLFCRADPDMSDPRKLRYLMHVVKEQLFARLV